MNKNIINNNLKKQLDDVVNNKLITIKKINESFKFYKLKKNDSSDSRVAKTIDSMIITSKLSYVKYEDFLKKQKFK